MSNSATEGGQGQGPADQQGQNGNQGQGPEGGQGQGQGPESQGGSDTYTAPDLSAIEDEALRTSLLETDRRAWENGREAARYRNERNTERQQREALQRQTETDAQRQEREAQERDQAAQAERDRIAALERENRDLKVGRAVTDAATNAKARNVNTVVALLSGKVETDDEGKPTNLEDLIRDLRESDPYLFLTQGNLNGGDGNGAGEDAPTDMNSIIRGQARARRGSRSTD